MIILDSMFYGCNSLILLDLPKINIQKERTMELILYDCNSLIKKFIKE